MAFVRKVIFEAASAGSIVGFSRLQISTKTGFAPQCSTAAAVATNVIEGHKTSSPGPIPRAFRARNRAAVPFETAIASVVPLSSAKAFSKASVRGPAVIHAESSVSRTPSSSRSSNSSSDSRAFHIGFKKGLLHSSKIVVCPLIIVGASDVHPVGIAFVGQNLLSVCDQPLNEIGKIVLLPARNVFTHGG